MSEKDTTTTTTTKGEGDATGKPTAKAPVDATNSASPYPDMGLAQDMHRVLFRKDLDLAQTVLDRIATELENPSLYELFQTAVLQKWKNDNNSNSSALKFLSSSELQAMKTAHATKKTELEAAVEEAKESAGDMEVMDALMTVARFAAKSLPTEEAMTAFQNVVELPKLSSGKKMDCYMELARVAAFAYSLPHVHPTAATKEGRSSTGTTTTAAALSESKTSTTTAPKMTLAVVDEWIDKADKLAQSGSGDWDRRNRVAVYKALQCLLKRDLSTAAEITLQGIATFTSTELCSYQSFLIYAALTNVLHLPRPQLHQKILNGPELLAVAHDIPVVMKLIRSYYDCEYKAYLHAMVEVEDILLNDRYLAVHASYWMRELHLLIYQQFLDSYQSVTLEAMAQQFGVSVAFLDYHASQFIAAGRLSAKIDKYGGTIVTNRADWTNAKYRQVIQKGDALLNRIQKLARVVDV